MPFFDLETSSLAFLKLASLTLRNYDRSTCSESKYTLIEKEDCFDYRAFGHTEFSAMIRLSDRQTIASLCVPMPKVRFIYTLCSLLSRYSSPSCDHFGRYGE